MKLIFSSIKRNFLPFSFIIFALSLIVFSKSNLTAAKSGLTLWATSVVPSLFPFFVITELISNTNIIYYIGKIFNKIMRPLFNVPGEAAFALIMGFICGYPTGAKIVSSLRTKQLCTKDEGDRILCFTNNSGPLFIISFVGISLFADTKTGILLLCTHILAGITIGIIFGKLSILNNKININNLKRNYSYIPLKSSISFNDLGEILGKSIQNSISTILLIGGFIIIFSIIISVFYHTYLIELISYIIKPILFLIGFDTSFAKPIISGIIELTNGINMTSLIHIKNISQNIIICAFLLGFGGISVLFQVLSIISKTDLSIKKYIIGKLFQGIIAAIYTYLALICFPILNLDLL